VVGVALSDLDGDGNADIIVACTNQNELRILKNRGGSNGFDGAYVLPYGTGQIPTPRHVAAADLDGNGQNDIIVGTDADLRVLTNPGGATTSTATASPTCRCSSGSRRCASTNTPPAAPSASSSTT
jgi:hypothetical protein